MLKGVIANMLLVVLLGISSVALGRVPPTTPTSKVLDTADIQMTLSAIAYVDANDSLEQIRAAVKYELAKTKYATRGHWRLAWGPAIKGGNVVYIAQNTEKRHLYSVIIRGTDFNLLNDDIEDIWVAQVPYPYADGANGYPKVSRGALKGLHNIQQMTDVVIGQNIEAFLEDIAKKNAIDLVVTGHSLGGGLASLVLLWLYDTIPQWDILAKNVNLSGYTFAGHTVGNADFANYFNASVGAHFYRFVNPLDIVPRSYSDLSSVLNEDIPRRVPLKYVLVLDALRAYLSLHGLKFHQVDTEVLLDSVDLAPSTPYLTHVLEQHRPNSYLHLLDAPELDVGEASALPIYDD